MENVFISYHHANDQYYKEELCRLNAAHGLFVDVSVDTGDIPDYLDDLTIRERIRDDYLRDSTVTVVLVGQETRRRKHVDWEIYSSMFDGKVNKKSGIIVVTLPCTQCSYFTSTHDGEKERVYPDVGSWTSIDSRAEYERRYPYLPDRIIDNLLKSGARISVTNWDRILADPARMRFLVDAAARDSANCAYDLSRPMRRSNS